MAAPTRAFVGLGANLGDRVAALRFAVAQLRRLPQCQVLATSRLYESAPLHLTSQPAFLNAAVELRTSASPEDLLVALQGIELAAGRRRGAGPRYGPRPLDLDLLVYGTAPLRRTLPDDQRLEVPHPRMQERAFVLRPLGELWDAAPSGGEGELAPVFPAGGEKLWRLDGPARVMGILNVTPDSFSDGGRHGGATEAAVAAALRLVEDGADVVDVGGESTRPGAAEVPLEEELARVVPVLAAIRGRSEVALSVDTRKAVVAEAAVAAGATMINDVSGGKHDAAMLATAARLQVPLVLMHMRGTPETMATLTDYDDVVGEVDRDLRRQASAAQRAGVSSWDIMLDPGIGFAKTPEQSVALLRGLKRFQPGAEAEEDADVQAQMPYPLLIGASRKRFIGGLTGETVAGDRDWGSVGAALAATARGAFMLRVHNVRGTKQALQVWDAVQR